VKKHALPWPTENPRAREEWDFRPKLLPKEEIDWCFQYEMDRVRLKPHWVAFIQKFRQDSGDGSYSALFRKAEECRRNRTPDEWPRVFHALWPEWPNRPYLSVERSTRLRRLQDWARFPSNKALKTIDLKDLLKADQHALGSSAAFYDYVEVPLYLTEKEALKAFRGYLLQRKKRNPTTEFTRGAAAPNRRLRADLCAIGLWRLVESGLTRQQAIIYSGKISGRTLFSLNPSAWTRALNRAKKIVRFHRRNSEIM
jgi:hypothetical protein